MRGIKTMKCNIINRKIIYSCDVKERCEYSGITGASYCRICQTKCPNEECRYDIDCKTQTNGNYVYGRCVRDNSNYRCGTCDYSQDPSTTTTTTSTTTTTTTSTPHSSTVTDPSSTESTSSTKTSDISSTRTSSTTDDSTTTSSTTTSTTTTSTTSTTTTTTPVPNDCNVNDGYCMYDNDCGYLQKCDGYVSADECGMCVWNCDASHWYCLYDDDCDKYDGGECYGANPNNADGSWPCGECWYPTSSTSSTTSTTTTTTTTTTTPGPVVPNDCNINSGYCENDEDCGNHKKCDGYVSSDECGECIWDCGKSEWYCLYDEDCDKFDGGECYGADPNNADGSDWPCGQCSYPGTTTTQTWASSTSGTDTTSTKMSCDGCKNVEDCDAPDDYDNVACVRDDNEECGECDYCHGLDTCERDEELRLRFCFRIFEGFYV